jgi:large subunit ribosomal protein L23
MSLFTRSKKEDKALVKKTPPPAAPLRPAKIKETAEVIKAKTGSADEARIAAKKSTVSHLIFKKPLVTEKSVNLSDQQNKYVFVVMPAATSSEVKKAVQSLYGVKVIKVNMINVPGKKRRLGQSEGFRPGFRKAIVTLSPEDKIEVASR